MPLQKKCVCLLVLALCGIQENGIVYADLGSTQAEETDLDKAQCSRRALILGETSSAAVPILDVYPESCNTVLFGRY